jgi:hypothetical protein
MMIDVGNPDLQPRYPWKQSAASPDHWSCVGHGVNLFVHRYKWSVRMAPLGRPTYDCGMLIGEGEARTVEMAKIAAEDCYAALTRHVMRLTAVVV